MKSFEVYIEDERYSTPTLIFIQMRDQQRALEYAQKKLDEDPRHLGIEVRENGLRIFGLGTLAEHPTDPAGRPENDTDTGSS